MSSCLRCFLPPSPRCFERTHFHAASIKTTRDQFGLNLTTEDTLDSYRHLKLLSPKERGSFCPTTQILLAYKLLCPQASISYWGTWKSVSLTQRKGDFWRVWMGEVCWLASLTFRNMMNPHLSWLGTRWVCAAHLSPAESSGTLGTSPCSISAGMEVIPWQLQPHLQPNRLRGNHSQLVIVDSVYTKHMWHLKTFRKQTFKSSFLSPPCLDGAPAFPSSESAPRKCVMPWEGGKEGRREKGKEGRSGCCAGRHLCPRCRHLTQGSSGMCALPPITAPSDSQCWSDIPGLQLTRGWMCRRCTGGEILLQTAGVSSSVLRVLLLVSQAEISHSCFPVKY